MKLTARVQPCGACWIYSRRQRQQPAEAPAAPPAEASAPAAPPPAPFVAPCYPLEPCPNRGLHGVWSARFTILRSARGEPLCGQCGGTPR